LDLTPRSRGLEAIAEGFKRLAAAQGYEDHETATRAFPQNSENFFYLCSMRSWQPRGRERDGLRESFLPSKSIAGGNWAREHQSLAIKIKLNT